MLPLCGFSADAHLRCPVEACLQLPCCACLTLHDRQTWREGSLGVMGSKSALRCSVLWTPLTPRVAMALLQTPGFCPPRRVQRQRATVLPLIDGMLTLIGGLSATPSCSSDPWPA